MRPRLLSACYALTFTLGLAQQALASEPPPGKVHTAEEMRQRRVAMRLQTLSTNLNLTEDQKGQIRPLIEAEVDQLRALRLDESLSPEEKQTQLEVMHRATRTQIRQLLTPDQQKKLDEMKARNLAIAQDSMTQKRKGKVPVADED